MLSRKAQLIYLVKPMTIRELQKPVIVLIAFVVALAGCAGGGAKFRPSKLQSGTGVIYVYMPSTLFLSNVKGLLTVSVDGQEVGYVGPGIYYPIVAKPGLRHVKLGNHANFGLSLTGRDTVKVPVAAGQTYYVRLSQISYTATAHSIVPERVSSEIGATEIRDTHRG